MLLKIISILLFIIAPITAAIYSLRRIEQILKHVKNNEGHFKGEISKSIGMFFIIIIGLISLLLLAVELGTLAMVAGIIGGEGASGVPLGLSVIFGLPALWISWAMYTACVKNTNKAIKKDV